MDLGVKTHYGFICELAEIIPAIQDSLRISSEKTLAASWKAETPSVTNEKLIFNEVFC